MDMIKLVLHTTVDVVLFFHERKLIEVFYDPIFSKAKIVVCTLAVAACVVVANLDVRGFRFPPIHAAPSQR